MKKEDRQKVFDKYGGRCAYCGCELPANWHCDHLEPVNRTQKKLEGYHRHKETKERIASSNLPERWYMEYEYIPSKYVFDKMLNPERDTVDNAMPSCHSCNITKSNEPLEDFRGYIEGTVAQLNKSHNACFKFAKRFGLVQETPKPVVFFFETFNIKK
jgi:hypothetical protein